jgi:hypothetical protein
MDITIVMIEHEPPEPTVKEHDGYWLNPPCDPVYASIMEKN